MYDGKIELKERRVCGYRIFADKNHPLANDSNYVYYHRHVASIKVERWLGRNEHVHHIDGNKENNDASNLIILTKQEHAKIHNPSLEKVPCENCSKIFEREKNKNRFCSQACSNIGRRKVERPTIEQLKKDAKELNFCAMGRKYGVSDNAIRKWFKQYGLLAQR